MNNINEIKDEKGKKVSELIEKCTMFFAFSDEQFQKNKTPLQEGDKYVHMGVGGYLPKSKVDTWLKGIEDIDKWYKGALKDRKLRRANIAYELANHEAFYTCDIEETLEVLGDGYTYDEVMEVYKVEKRKQLINN